MIIDRCYIAVSTFDIRLARICVASVRTFYPDLPISLLAGGELPPNFVEEMARYWNVDIANFPLGHYGWGYVKLEPLFQSNREAFLILDSDTVLSGPILQPVSVRCDAKNGDAQSETSSPNGVDGDATAASRFIVDDEKMPEAEMRRLYYDWDRLKEVDPNATRPLFVFNSGQWFGVSGILKRDDFSPWVEWTMPRKLTHPGLFMPGDQGVLNYVLNQKAASGEISVRTVPLMHWPGWGMEAYSAKKILDQSIPPRIIHWAGVKKIRLNDIPGADILTHFEIEYYKQLPYGSFLRYWRAWSNTKDQVFRRIQVRISSFWQSKVLGSK